MYTNLVKKKKNQNRLYGGILGDFGFLLYILSEIVNVNVFFRKS